MKPLKAGVIGYGVMGKHHARVLNELVEFELVGIFDPFSELAVTPEGKPIFRNFEDFLRLELEYCVVATPTSTHLDFALRLAEFSIHLLIEKPLALNSNEASKIVSRFQNSQVVVGVGQIERFNPSLLEMKNLLQDGILGEVFQISTIRQGPYPGRILDVGVVKDLATHDINATSWIGNSSYEFVHALKSSHSETSVEDLILVIGKLKNGILLSHSVNWISPYKDRKLVVLGQKGILEANLLTSDLTFYENGLTASDWGSLSVLRGLTEGKNTRFALNKIEPLKREHIEMQRAISSGNRKNIVSLKEGLDTIVSAEMILNSAV